MFKIIVPGQPVGKGRPRFSLRGGTPRAHTPKKTSEYEDEIRIAWHEAYKGAQPTEAALSVKMVAYMQIPKSATRTRRREMLGGTIRPTKKPDIDNITKCALDALNGYAYKDDNQVIELSIEKHYSENPRLEIEIKELF